MKLSDLADTALLFMDAAAHLLGGQSPDTYNSMQLFAFCHFYMSLSVIHTGGHRDDCAPPSSYPGGRKPGNHSHGNRPGVIDQEVQGETEDRK